MRSEHRIAGTGVQMAEPLRDQFAVDGTAVGAVEPGGTPQLFSNSAAA